MKRTANLSFSMGHKTGNHRNIRMGGIDFLKCYKEIAGCLKRKKVYLWANLGELLGGDNHSGIILRRV